MLVFAVLLDRSGITAAQGGGLQATPATAAVDPTSGDTIEEAKKDVGAGVRPQTESVSHRSNSAATSCPSQTG